MTKTFLICACAAVALTACEQQNPPAEVTQAPDVPSLVEESAPPVAPVKPEPTPAPVAEVAPPPAKPTVGSTVWAVSRISVTTDDGIVVIAPGAKLRVARETETGYVVTDEKQEFPVASGQVSLNSGAASSAAQAEAAARAANYAWQQSQNAAGTSNARIAMANQAVGELQTRYDQLVREEANLQAAVQRAHAEDLQAHTAANQRRVYTRSISPSQAAAWKSRLPAVQAEKDKLFWQLKQARQQ
jgi:hypothetical protein